jgi:GAF domain-containing protein
MKRRSRAGGKLAKGRRRKAPKPERRNVPKTAPSSESSPSREDTVVARLTHELRETTEQHTATSDILRVISSSPSDLQPVFQAMLENAVRLCDAKFGNIYRWDGDALHLVASQNVPPAFVQARGRAPLRPSRQTPTGRMIATKTVVHAPDMRAEKAYADRDPYIVAGVELGGVRTILMVPMLKDDELIGAFSVYRQEVRPFTPRQIALVQNFASQAVIAIENARLLNELRQRTADLAQALEQQTATSEVLQIISGSPGELEPVFQAMLQNATHICEAEFGVVFSFDGREFQVEAQVGTPPELAEYLNRAKPMPQPLAGSHLDRLRQTKRVSYTPDYAAEGISAPPVTLGGARSTVDVPMLKDNELVGAFSIYRQQVRPFTEKQIALVKNFAAQAVIAIENARLLNELREALQQQTATSEVLGVISSSPGDLEAVFRTMLENATRICEAKFGTLDLYEGGGLRLAAAHDVPPVFTEGRGEGPFQPAPGGILDTAMKTKRTVHLHDLATTDAYAQRHPRMVDAVEVAGIRTAVGVPMLKDEELVGIIAIFRQDVRPFTEKQIELFTNFANQAVIAIENARLLHELRQRTTDLTEALEQQRATSGLLQVISGSPGNLEPVFQAMLENAVGICGANFGNMFLYEDNAFRAVAMHNAPEAYANARKGAPFAPPSDSALGRLVVTREAVQVADLRLEERYSNRDPFVVAAVELADIRTLLAVPMLKEDRLVGAIVIYRQEVCRFTEKQIELVKNFASQVVIAIENTRLLHELRQSLEEQTATSDVLRIISRSPGEVEPVFAAMLASATRICEAEFGNLFLREEDAFRAVAWHGEPTYVNTWRGPALVIKTDIADIPLARVAATKRRVHVADLRQEASYKAGFEPLVALIDKGGARTLLIVPMLKERTLIGAIAIYRQEVRPFTDKQIGLVENFAAQAVIAIENARLLRELRERTEEVEGLNQRLEQRVTDQVDEIERMSRLRRFLPPQVADLIVASGSERQLESHRREITALFCDLRGFTGFTESADAEDVMALLRDYHAAIGETIIKYNGTLERYAGDGVMVVFNDPVPIENPALQAVLMALELRNALGALTQTWSRLGHEIGFGIGIAHGFATLGTIGFEGRFDYAAIGTVSNVASRLCDEAKPGQILISPRVLMKVENAVEVEHVGEFELKGIRRPLAAYNVIGVGTSTV